MVRLLVLASLCGMLGLGTPTARAEPLVKALTLAEEDGGYVLRVHATDRIGAYWEPRLTVGHQVEWVLIGVELAPDFRQGKPLGPVEQVVVQAGEGHLVVSVQLEEGVRITPKAFRDRDTYDVLLALEPAAVPLAGWSGAARRPPAHPTARRAAPTAAARTTPPPARTTPPPARTTPPPAPSTSAASGEVDARRRWRLDTVVLDAGHGGHDTGAQGHGLREKDITLAVTRRLGRKLEQELGVAVVYTRDDDRFVTLKDRGRLANQAGGKLFLSIHVNAATNAAAYGTETYFLGMHKTEAAQHVMERENDVVRLEADPTHYAGFDEQAVIVQALAQSAYMRKSEQLAAAVEAQFSDTLGRKSRGVKQAGFFVLWNASMPAVLVEIGFISHPDEAAYLGSEAGQEATANAILEAVRAYKEQYERGLDLVVY